MNLETASPLLWHQCQKRTGGQDGGDLSGDVDGHGMHQKEVLIILLLAHFVDDASGHGERRNACCPNHGVDLLPFRQEEIYQFCHKHASGGVQHEARKA